MSSPLATAAAPSIIGSAQALPVASAVIFATVAIGSSSKLSTNLPTSSPIGSTISSYTKSAAPVSCAAIATPVPTRAAPTTETPTVVAT